MTVRIVTDSTSDLPQDIVQRLGITVVPLNVHFGTDSFKDGVDISADEFYDRLLNGPILPTTSQPSIGEFAQTYEEVAGDADGILSIHISSKVSGTYNSAVQASSEARVSCPVEVVDTQQMSMGLGMTVMAAAAAVQKGCGLEEATAVVKRASELAECIALFETLEYLQKGGRVGKAGALIGSLLRIRPMIIIRDGEVHELAKERSRPRGMARLQRTAREFAPVDELAVIHSTTPEDARAVADNLRDLLPDSNEPIIARFGPVVGTYAGPGALGLGLLRSGPA